MLYANDTVQYFGCICLIVCLIFFWFRIWNIPTESTRKKGGQIDEMILILF